MTDNERAAWWEGVNAGMHAAVAEVRAMAARLRAMDPVRLEVLSNAATLEQAADMLEAKASNQEPTGLEFRGG